MWPFSRKKTNEERAEAAIAVLDDAKTLVAARWMNFNDKLKFKDDAPLGEIIFAFAMPMFEGLRRTFPALKDAPDAVLMFMIAKGIQQTGTHTREQIEAALGAPLMD